MRRQQMGAKIGRSSFIGDVSPSQLLHNSPSNGNNNSNLGSFFLLTLMITLAAFMMLQRARRSVRGLLRSSRSLKGSSSEQPTNSREQSIAVANEKANSHNIQTNGKSDDNAEALEQLLFHFPSNRVRIGIYGSAAFYSDQSQALCEAIGAELAERVPNAVLLTGGVAKAQEVITSSFAKALKKRKMVPAVYHLLPPGESCAFEEGDLVRAGGDMKERRQLLAMASNIAIAVEGGPGAVEEMTMTMEREGSLLIPLARSGGAAAGMFGAPTPPKPPFATEAQWKALKDKEAAVDSSARATVEIIVQYVKGKPGMKGVL